MRFRTAAIVIGVNKAPGQKSLRNAENDARDLASFLAGPSGPVGTDDVFCIIGREATRFMVNAVFQEAARRHPNLLFVVFSGHGNNNSICLADGEFTHVLLANRIRRVRAKRTAVVIDSCHAGAIASLFDFRGFGEIPDASWQELLARMLPGIRLLLASRAEEVSSDGQGSNGTFTQGLLLALRYLSGDLVFRQHSYITAEAMFRYASRFVQHHTDGRQTPVAFGPVADFPIARPQPQPIVVRPVMRAQPATSTSSGSGILTFLFLAALGGLGIYAWSRHRRRWDPNIGRYRGRDGRFC